MTEATTPLDSDELAAWRAKHAANRARHPSRYTREVVTFDAGSPVDDGGEVVDEDTVAWEPPKPSYVRSGSEGEVFLRLVDRLTAGYREVAKYLVALPNVQSELKDGQVEAWARSKAEGAVRRVYADIKPVRSDLATVAKGNIDGDTG